MDQRRKAVRQGRAQPREVGRIALQASEGGVRVALTEKGHPPGEALVEHQTERVEVSPPVEFLATDLLWRQVLGGAHHHVLAGEVVGAAQPLRDPEVGEQDPAVGRDEDVAGLDIAMHETGGVGGIESGGNARADVHRQVGT